MKNPVIVRAFVRSLEVIGEAAKNVLRKFREKYPHAPWKEMAGMRDKLIHEYFGIDYKIVWKTVKHEIPKSGIGSLIYYKNHKYIYNCKIRSSSPPVPIYNI